MISGMASVGSTESWAGLRSTRSSPPGLAGEYADRRSVYTAALEQAQQLFGAAEHAGCASRPLLAFYGLSQAGRALAAAARATTGHEWLLAGHGLRAPDLTAALPEVPIVQSGGGQSSFIRLSALLNSPSIPHNNTSKPVTIGDLWDLIPDVVDKPLIDRANPRLPLFCVPVGSDSRAPSQAIAIVGGFPRTIREHPLRR
jgi:hypothetical protein